MPENYKPKYLVLIAPTQGVINAAAEDGYRFLQAVPTAEGCWDGIMELQGDANSEYTRWLANSEAKAQTRIAELERELAHWRGEAEMLKAHPAINRWPTLTPPLDPEADAEIARLEEEIAAAKAAGSPAFNKPEAGLQ